jgi:hypothetical protein
LFRAWHDWLTREGTWPRIGLLLVGCLGCMAGFALREQVTRLGAVRDPGPGLDARYWLYSPAEARDYFAHIGAAGRGLYVSTQLTLDVLLPLFYGGLLACLIARLGPPAFARTAVGLPVGAAAADLGENMLLAYLAYSFDWSESSLARLAAGFTAAKTLLLVASLAGVLVGVVWQAWAWMRPGRPGGS